jgi:hypothetical protein
MKVEIQPVVAKVEIHPDQPIVRVMGTTGQTGLTGIRWVYSTWAALSAVTGPVAGYTAEVPTSDAGTHTDPVVGGTVSNSGIYSWSVTPAGWKRVADTDAISAKPYADAAAASASAAAAASYNIECGVHISDSSGIQNGVYLAGVNMRATTLGRLYAQIVQGGGTGTLSLLIDGHLAYGPVNFGPEGFLDNALVVSVPEGARAEIQLSGLNDTMTEIIVSVRAAAVMAAGGNTAAALTFNNSGAGAASGAVFNGSAAITISSNTIGAQPSNLNLTAYAGANWTGGVQIPALIGVNNVALKTVGSAAGNILDKAAGDSLYVPGTLDTDPLMAANSNTRVPSQAAVRTYVSNALTSVYRIKGSTDCSTNPNYPAATAGDAYVVTVAGKIGGASGDPVDVGDVYFAVVDNAGGTKAAVGASWDILEHNLAGALLSANNLSDITNPTTARANLGLVIGTDVQAYDADLAAIAALTTSGFGRGFLVLADAAAARAYIGAGGNDRNVQFNNAGTPDGAAAVDIDVDGNLRLDSTTPSVSPGVDQLALMADRLAGGGGTGRLRTRGEDGIYRSMQTHFGFNSIVWSQAVGASASLPTVNGLTGWTSVGTVTNRAFGTTSRATRLRRVGYVSAAGAGNAAGLYNGVSANNAFTTGGADGAGHLVAFRFVPSDAAAVATAHMFVGMINTTAAPGATTNPNTLTNCFGVAQCNGSANLQIVYGGSAAQAPIDLGANFPAGGLSTDAYLVIFYARPDDATKVAYYVKRLNTGDVASGVLTGVAGTALPANTTLLGARCYRANNATALAVGIDFASFYAEADL